MEPGLFSRYMSVERGMPSRRMNPWRLLVWVVSQALFFCLGFIVGPLVLAIDIGRFGQRAGKPWVVSYLLMSLFITGVTLNVKQVLLDERHRVLEIITEYSNIKAETTDVPFYSLIRMYALRVDLDPALVAAVVKKESMFDPHAISPVGARGLMQIHPVTWRYIHPESDCSGRHYPPACGDSCIFDPETNIAVGTSYLRQLLDEFEGNVVLAFAAYNAGPTAVRRYSGGMLGHGLPPYRETVLFVEDVIEYWMDLRNDPPPVEVDPARLNALAELDHLLHRVSLGYWVLFVVWAVFKIPWSVSA